MQRMLQLLKVSHHRQGKVEVSVLLEYLRAKSSHRRTNHAASWTVGPISIAYDSHAFAQT